MARLGADVDQMDALASFFDDAAKTLDGHASIIDGEIRALWWRGSIADRFTAVWASADRKRVTTTADGLRSIAKKVRQNAAQQRAASGGGLLGGASFGVPDVDVDFLRFGGAVVPAEGTDPELTQQWWDSLSEEQRREVVAKNPGFGNREDLPLDIRFEANHMSVEANLADLRTTTAAYEAELRQKLESGELHPMDDEALEMMELIAGSHRTIDTATRLLYVHDQDGNLVFGENGQPIEQQILYADLENGDIAVVTGDLKSADEVLITTPGTGTDVHKYASNFLPESQILVEGETGRAVISTFMWDPPPGLANNLSVHDYTPTIMDGGMDNVVRTAAAHSSTVISVSHSAGTDAVTYYAEHSEAAELIDGYVMLAAPNPEAAPDAIGGKPIAFGYHNEDFIRRTDWVQPDGFFDIIRGNFLGPAGVDNYADAVHQGEEHPNVSAEMKPSGLDGGYLNQGVHHRNSAYFENFDDMIDGMVEEIQTLRSGAANVSLGNVT